MHDSQSFSAKTLKRIEQEIQTCKAQALSIVDQYWEWRAAQNKAQPHNRKSRLGLRVRDTKSGSFVVEWYAFHWVTTQDGNRQ
ncbi:MAG: conjugative transfer protein MobI(A/C), partial [Acidobacteriaceae bacterium]